MSGRRFFGQKKAGVTVEVTMSIALGVIVLFLAIGLFNDNLSSMAAHSGLNNLFKRQSPSASDWGKTSTKTQIALSQNNVQLVGDQAQTKTLEQYLAEVQSTIDKYNGRTDLSQPEQEDLGRAAIAKYIGGGRLDTSVVSLCRSNNILPIYSSSSNEYKAIIKTSDSKSEQISVRGSSEVNVSDEYKIAMINEIKNSSYR